MRVRVRVRVRVRELGGLAAWSKCRRRKEGRTDIRKNGTRPRFATAHAANAANAVARARP